MEGGSLTSAANMNVSKTVSIGKSWSSCITAFQTPLCNPSCQGIKKCGFPSTTRSQDGHDLTPHCLARDVIEKIRFFLDPNPVFFQLLHYTIRKVIELKSMARNHLQASRRARDFRSN